MATENNTPSVITPEESTDLARLFNIVTRLIEHGRPQRPEGARGHGPDAPGPRMHGMHPGKHRVLAALSDVESISQKDLLDKLGVSAAALSEMLRKLEAHELITRKRDENDKRVINVAITEKGAVRYAEAEMMRAERNEKLFAALTPEEREQLGGLLVKLIDAWHADPAILAEMAPRHRRGCMKRHGCEKSPEEKADCHAHGGHGPHPEMGHGMGHGHGHHGHCGHHHGHGGRF